MQDIEQMAQFARKYSSFDMFVNDMNLLGIAGEEPGEYGDREHIVLSTIHQAKGLEWRHVFVIGLNEGWFPALRALHEDSVEEERRLFYVAATRAREQLYLCFPVISEDWYSPGSFKPSRFIQELPRHLYEEIHFDSCD
jgi:DNA helicase-2/ATP-dependent DNA helicase PcrA